MIRRLPLTLLLPPLLLAPLLLAPLLLATAVPSADAEPQRPAPPQSTPRTYPVNPEVCRPERIRSSWRERMLPWADQSAAVRTQLLRVQAEITAASLRRCVEQGLLSRPEADQLAAELGLGGGGAEAPATRP